jgi:predicted dehydrogenase
LHISGRSIVKVGLLGLGFMGKRHLDAYATLSGVDVVTRRSAQFAHIDPQDRASLTQAMLDDTEISAIDICLPTNDHKQVAIAALEAGKHVLCEKPMALHPADCSAMLLAAARNQRVLMVAHVLRFWPAYCALRALLDSGEYGQVQRAKFVRRSAAPDWGDWFANPTRTGGATLDLLIHDIDQALLLFGPPVSASATSLDAPDAAHYTLHYADGLDVEIEGGWFRSGEPFAMSFAVATNSAELIFENDGVSIKQANGFTKTIPLSTEDPYARQLAYFLDCCRLSRIPSECPPESSAQSVELACSLRELACSGTKFPQALNLKQTDAYT